MLARSLGSLIKRTPTASASSPLYFKSTTLKINYNKQHFQSTPVVKLQDGKEVDPTSLFYKFDAEGIFYPEKPIVRAYESQFYSYFPNLITKKKTSITYEEWLTKEIDEINEEYDKLKRIFLTDDTVHSMDQRARNFVVEEGITIHSGTNCTLPDEIIEKYLPEGWGKKNKIHLDFEAAKEKNIFIRPWIFDIIESINKQKSENFLSSKDCKTIIVNGFHGIGISTLLSVLAIYGRSNNWITVNVSGNRITSDHNIDPSRVLRFRYDQNKCAIDIMESTLKTNEAQLSQIPLRTPVPTHLLEEGLEITKNSSLADILKYGINNEDSATDIFCYFRRELNLVTEFPVLLIVDDYNTLFNPAYYPDMHNPSYAVKRIAPEKLNLVRCFNDPNSTGLLNGVMVCGTTGVEPCDNLRQKYGKIITPIPGLSFDEVRFRLKYLAKRNLIVDNMPEETYKYFHQVICGSFLEFSKYMKYVS